MRKYYGFEDRYHDGPLYNADGYRVGTVYVFDSKHKLEDWMRGGERRKAVSETFARDWMLHYVGPWSRLGMRDVPITTHSSSEALVDAYIDFASMNGADDVWNGV